MAGAMGHRRDTNGKIIKFGQKRRSAVNDKGAVINHGEPAAFRQVTYQCHATSLHTVQEISRILSFYTITSPWDTSTIAFAYRVNTDPPTSDAEEGEGKQKETAHHRHFSEGYRDCNPRIPHQEDLGAGQKMLKLLQRWDVRNILLVSTRWDSLSFTDSADTPLRFGTLLKCAKNVLEVVYYESAVAAAHRGQQQQQQLQLQQPPKPGGWSPGLASHGPPSVLPKRTGRTRTIEPKAQRIDNIAIPQYGRGSVYQRQRRTGMGSFMHGRATTPPQPLTVEQLAIPPKKIKPRFRRLMVQQGPALTRQQVTELKSIKQPPHALLSVMQCTATLKQLHVRDWPGVLDMLHRDGGTFLRQTIDLRTLRKDSVEAVREFLTQTDMTALRRSSPLVNNLLDWVIKVVQLVDFVVTNRPPPGSIWVDTDTLPKMPLPGTTLDLDL